MPGAAAIDPSPIGLPFTSSMSRKREAPRVMNASLDVAGDAAAVGAGKESLDYDNNVNARGWPGSGCPLLDSAET